MHLKTGQYLSALWRLVSRPEKSLRAIHVRFHDNKYWRGYVREKHGFPNGLPQVDILGLFPDFRETVSPYAFLEGSSLPVDLALLKALARHSKECDYFEIGRWRGESTANVAQVARSCTSMSLSDEDMRRIGFNKSEREQDGFFSKSLDNVTHIQADSQTYDFSKLGNKFDLIFVDGDHHKAAITSDTANVFTLLKDENSVIVWHDYGESPERVRWAVLAGILDGCPEQFKKNLYHVSNTLCAVYMPGKFATRETVFPATPDKRFSLEIKAETIK